MSSGRAAQASEYAQRTRLRANEDAAVAEAAGAKFARPHGARTALRALPHHFVVFDAPFSTNMYMRGCSMIRHIHDPEAISILNSDAAFASFGRDRSPAPARDRKLMEADTAQQISTIENNNFRKAVRFQRG